MSIWKTIDSLPPEPTAVELFHGNMGDDYVISRVRDCRRTLGYWDGESFKELWTGHHVFESWKDARDLPTHWRKLPEVPQP